MWRCIFPALLSYLLAASASWAQQPAAISVATLTAELRPITKATEFVGRIEAKAPGAEPDLAKASVVCSVNAATPRPAINAKYILFVMARTIRWLPDSSPTRR